MTKLKVPTVQHLARNWQPTPQKTQKKLVSLAENPPIFNYNPLHGAVRDMLVFQQPYDEIEKGIRAKTRAGVRENLLEVLPLIRNHFDSVSPDFVQSVARRHYAIGRELLVPFDPPLIYGLGGKLVFPWFSFWRQNPLSGERLSLFVTLVDELLADDPDLAEAEFQILDFSSVKAPGLKNTVRQLRLIDAADVERLSDQRKTDMLAIFAEGYMLAQDELSRRPRQTSSESARDQRQGDFFNEGQSKPS